MSCLTLAAWASAHHADVNHLAKLNGRANATALIVDYTDGSWPMAAAAAEWDRSSRVELWRYTYCPSTADYCVPIYQSNQSSTAYGRTFSQGNGNGHYSRTGFYVILYATPSAYKRSVACHELGHVVGLNDRGSITSSCMATGSVFPNLPDGHDFDVLGGLYNHSS